MAEYAMESIIRGHHVYKTIWQPRLGLSSTLVSRELADSSAISIDHEL